MALVSRLFALSLFLCLGASDCGGGSGRQTPRDKLDTGAAAEKVVFVEARGLGRADVLQLASGARATCALLEDGGVGCWGGLFGDVPARLSGFHDIASIAVGVQHVCLLSRSGALFCGGSNEYGQSGHVERKPVHPIVQVARVEGVTAVFAGGDDTCVRGRGPGLVCWGRSYAAADDPMRRVELFAEHEIIKVGLSRYDNVALTASGRVLWWGRPEHVELHNDRYFATYREPAAVTLDGPARDVCAAEFHSCAIADSGTIHCWGQPGGVSGRLGFAWPHEFWPYQHDLISTIPDPPAVMGVEGAVELACGDYHSCARLASGEVRCWGGDTLLGSRLTEAEARRGAHAVASITDVVHIAVGERRACAALRSSSVVCWGDNGLGAVGVDGSVVPVVVDRRD